MSNMRYFNTKFWTDSYIENLTPEFKLLYAYFITSPQSNLCGVYEISFKRIATDTGLTEIDIKEGMMKFEGDKKIYYKSGFVILNNHLKNQRMNANMWSGAKSIFNSLPEDVRFFCENIKSFNLLHSNKKGKPGAEHEKIVEPKASLVPDSSSPADSTIEFEQFRLEMVNSGAWIQNISRKFDLKEVEVRLMLDEFLEERRIKSDWNFKENEIGKLVPKSLKQNKDHFYNVVRLKTSKKIKTIIGAVDVPVMAKMNVRKKSQ